MLAQVVAGDRVPGLPRREGAAGVEARKVGESVRTESLDGGRPPGRQVGDQDDGSSPGRGDGQGQRLDRGPRTEQPTVPAAVPEQGAEGLERIEEAVEIASKAPVRLELAKSLAALGVTRRRAGRPDYAREPLLRAHEVAEVCGAERLLAEIRTELLAVGADPRSAVPRGVTMLTATEKRVAALAAAGRAEREIAQELFVTPRTIEVKLSNALRKLGASSHTELAMALEM